MYSVEAEFIDRVVQKYGPCESLIYFTLLHQSLPLLRLATKIGAIVAGQTSVKAPEKAAFEAHLPPDVHIVSLHSLHGPSVPPAGQPLVRPWLLPPSTLSCASDLPPLLGHYQASCTG